MQVEVEVVLTFLVELLLLHQEALVEEEMVVKQVALLEELQIQVAVAVLLPILPLQERLAVQVLLLFATLIHMMLQLLLQVHQQLQLQVDIEFINGQEVGV
jgi:hypothetical protein